MNKIKQLFWREEIQVVIGIIFMLILFFAAVLFIPCPPQDTFEKPGNCPYCGTPLQKEIVDGFGYDVIYYCPNNDCPSPDVGKNIYERWRDNK